MVSTINNTSTGKQEVTLSALHLVNRRMFITGTVTDDMANDVIMQLLYLQDTGNDPVEIYINSPGGSVSAGLAIYDVLQKMTMPVNITCCGIAASMGAVILAGGQKGNRYIYPHARVMIHEAYMSGGIGGPADTIQNTATEMLKTQKVLNGILAEQTGHTEEEIEKACSRDNYMSAEEAVMFGICDEIA